MLPSHRSSLIMQHECENIYHSTISSSLGTKYVFFFWLVLEQSEEKWPFWNDSKSKKSKWTRLPVIVGEDVRSATCDYRQDMWLPLDPIRTWRWQLLWQFWLFFHMYLIRQGSNAGEEMTCWLIQASSMINLGRGLDVFLASRKTCFGCVWVTPFVYRKWRLLAIEFWVASSLFLAPSVCLILKGSC